MIDPFHYVFSAYNDPRRHYHDISHIHDMLNWAYLFGDPKQARDAYGKFLKRELYEAILFHDFVYDVVPGILSNEAKSAGEYLKWYAASYGSQTDYNPFKVSNMIRATEHHFDGTTYDDYLTNLLLDIDLLTFTVDYDEFESINEDIDKEFIPTYGETHTWRKRYAFLKNVYVNKLLMYRVIDTDGVYAVKAYQNLQRWLTENSHLEV